MAHRHYDFVDLIKQIVRYIFLIVDQNPSNAQKINSHFIIIMFNNDPMIFRIRDQ